MLKLIKNPLALMIQIRFYIETILHMCLWCTLAYFLVTAQ